MRYRLALHSIGPVLGSTRFVWAFSAVLFSCLLSAQDYAIADSTAPATSKRDPRPLMDRLWFGGGLNLSFGTVTYLGASPMVGYKIDQQGKWSAGIAMNYTHISDNRYTPSYVSSVYGGSLFTRYRVIPQLFLHAEYNQQNYQMYSPLTDASRREWVPYLLVGGGYSQQIAGNAYFTLQVLWDLIQDVRSPYGNQPFITGGVGVGF